MFLVDSSVWIEYLRPKGSPNVKERVRTILQKEEMVSCGIIVVEILRGAKNERDFESLRDLLMSLPQIPIDDTVIERASRWGFLPRQQKATAFGRDVAPLGREVGATGFARRAPLDRKGKVVSTTDLIIASAAYKEARLLHSDRDFDTIASIVDLEQEKI